LTVKIIDEYFYALLAFWHFSTRSATVLWQNGVCAPLRGLAPF